MNNFFANMNVAPLGISHIVKVLDDTNATH